MPTLPTKKQLDDAKPKFPLLPSEDYILRLETIEPVQKPNWNNTEEIDVMACQFSVVSLKDGSVATDEEGGRVHEKRRVFFDADESYVGFTKEGLPSKTRQFICYMIDEDPFSEEPLSYEWNDFKGKTITARIVIYLTKQGKKANKIIEFLPPRKKTFQEKLDTDHGDIPVLDDSKGMGEKGDGIDVKDIPY